jgi:hypothetical protein
MYEEIVKNVTMYDESLTNIEWKYDKYRMKVWQMYDESVTNIEWKCDKYRMKVWQVHDKSVTSVW